MVICKICLAPVSPFARARLLNRYDVSYHRCDECGFVQTEEPYWLEEAYSDAIAASDIGLVSRNIMLALMTRSLIRVCLNPAGRFLDYAGGYGLLVRLMRDAGYDFHLYDRHCDNIFAQGFAALDGDGGKYDLVTAFEFLEHTLNPLEEMELMLARSRNILFTTEIHPASAPRPEDWWYFGLDHGQHISIFSIDSLRIMADKLSLNYYTNGRSIHLFTERKLSPVIFKIATLYSFAAVVDIIFKRPSLLLSDFTAPRTVPKEALP